MDAGTSTLSVLSAIVSGGEYAADSSLHSKILGYEVQKHYSFERPN